MSVSLEVYQLKNLISEFSELGAANYAKIVNRQSDNMSQRQAYREFGESRVKNWDRQGLLSTVRNGTTNRSKIIYSRAELMTIESAEKLQTLINKQSS